MNLLELCSKVLNENLNNNIVYLENNNKTFGKGKIEFKYDSTNHTLKPYCNNILSREEGFITHVTIVFLDYDEMVTLELNPRTLVSKDDLVTINLAWEYYENKSMLKMQELPAN